MYNPMRKPALRLFALLLCFGLAAPARAQAVGGVPFGYQLAVEGGATLADGTPVLTPKASGTLRYSGGGATLDASNTAEGYIMAKYSGSTRAKLRITRTGGTTYTYDLRSDGTYEVFPLTGGSGGYQIQVYYNISGDQYALAIAENVDVSLRNNMLPFLYPNQFVNFTADSTAVAEASKITKDTVGDLAIITSVYNYVIANIGYDTDKAKAVSEGRLTGYVPVVDNVLASKKGICFDYAALMAAMLRSRQIPTRMEFGYVSGGVYHAWISTYVTGVGWVNGVIQFDGVNWKLMDPTFASGGGTEIMQFIGNGNNYKAVFIY